MAKKKSSERTLMWVFGAVAVVALLGVVALALGDGVTGMAKWTSPVFRTPITEGVSYAPTYSVAGVMTLYLPDGSKRSAPATITLTGEQILALYKQMEEDKAAK